MGNTAVHDGTVLREDQLARLRAAAPDSVILAVAPAGYGKSTLAIEAARVLDWDAVWLALGELDRDPVAFLSSFASALARRFPRRAKLLRQLSAQAARSDGSTAWVLDALVDELTDSHGEVLTLIVDDLHAVEDSGPTKALLDRLLVHAEGCCRFVLLGRRDPHLARLRRLRAQGRVTRLDHKDLTLDRRQTRQILERGGAPWQAESIDRCHAMMGGWAAGTVMLANALAATGDSSCTPLTVARIEREELFDYLASEVLEQERPELRDFLLRASLLDTLTPGLADDVAGGKAGRLLLRELDQRGLFLRQEPGRSDFRLHELFRSFLLRRLRERLGEEELGDLRWSLAQALDRKGSTDQAVRLLLESSRPADPARLLSSSGLDGLDACTGSTLTAVVDRLSCGRADAQAWRKLVSGYMAYRDGELTAAAAAVTTALNQSHGAGRKSLDPIALNVLQAIAYWSSDYDECLRQCEAALELDLPRALAASTLDSMAAALAALADWERFELTMARLRGYWADLAPGKRALVLALEASAADRRGRVSEARRISASAARAMARHPRYLNFLVFRAYVEIDAAEYQVAQECLVDALRLTDRLGQHEAMCSLHDNLGWLAACTGRLDEAVRHFDAARSHPSFRHDPETASDILCHLGTMWRRFGRPKRAVKLHEQSARRADLMGVTWEQCAARIELAYARVVAGRQDGAVEELARLGDASQAKGFESLAARARFFAAMLGCRTARDAESLDRLSLQVGALHEMGHVAFISLELALEPGTTAALLGEADPRLATGVIDALVTHWDAQRVLKDVKARLDACAPHSIGRRLAGEALARLSHGHATTRSGPAHLGEPEYRVRFPELTRRECEILRLLAEGSSNAGIAAELSLSPATVKTHVHRILAKLRSDSRAKAAHLYHERIAG